jgi:acylphosphatase
MDPAELVTIAIVVHGRVQGVGFRAFVYERATHLGLTGWTRNLPDGSVEVVARGPRADIDILRAALRQGPRVAYVTSVTETWLASDAMLPSSFEIR